MYSRGQMRLVLVSSVVCAFFCLATATNCTSQSKSHNRKWEAGTLAICMIQSSARNSILAIYGWTNLAQALILGWSNLPQYQEWSLSVAPTFVTTKGHQEQFPGKRATWATIFLSDAATARFCVATIHCLFHWKARRHQWRLDKVRTSDTVMTVRCWQ